LRQVNKRQGYWYRHDTDTHQYWRVSADTRYWYRSNPTHQDASDLELCC